MNMENTILCKINQAQKSKGGSVVKNLPTMQKMRVWSLDLEDPLEEEMATLSSIPPWEIPRTEKPGRLTDHGIAKESDTIPWLKNNKKNLKESNL